MKIGCHEVLIWRLNLNNLDWSLYQPILNEAEIAKSMRLRIVHKRHAFITTRGILRLLLSKKLHISPQNVEFCFGPHGKPAVIPSQNTGNIHFNVSHSGTYALIAFARDAEIGIDVEEIKPYRNVAELATTVFSEIELQAFLQLSPSDQYSAFYMAWTRKEALVKALGNGLTMPLKNFAVSFDAEVTDILWYGSSMPALQSYRFHTIDIPDPLYRATLATLKTYTAVQLQDFEQSAKP